MTNNKDCASASLIQNASFSFSNATRGRQKAAMARQCARTSIRYTPSRLTLNAILFIPLATVVFQYGLSAARKPTCQAQATIKAVRRRDDGAGARSRSRAHQDRPALGLCRRRPAMG